MSILHDLRQTPRLGLLVGGTAATIGIIYGYDMSNIAGALLFITKEFQLSTSQQELVTTAVVVGEVLGAVVGGWLANKLGRKACMVGLAGAYAALRRPQRPRGDVPMLLVARLLLGLTIGISVVVVPVFVAESAPPKVRGALLVAYQVATVIGIIIGYLAAYVLSGTENWRLDAGPGRCPGPRGPRRRRQAPGHRPLVHDARTTEDARRTLSAIEPDADVDAELAQMRVPSARARRRTAGDAPHRRT
jgi:SP family galactose:H+ symporter-like MFS transporter